jgi:hypothetical protein
MRCNYLSCATALQMQQINFVLTFLGHIPYNNKTTCGLLCGNSLAASS